MRWNYQNYHNLSGTCLDVHVSGVSGAPCYTRIPSLSYGTVYMQATSCPSSLRYLSYLWRNRYRSRLVHNSNKNMR